MGTSPKVLLSETQKRTRTRSPAYPFISLEAAIQRAKKFYEKEQHHGANLRVAVAHWGYDQKSSGGLQTAAALVQFGLMKDEGTGPQRKVQLTSNGLTVVLAPADSVERAEAVKKAALTPRVHQQLWQRWGANLPSDASLKYTLLSEWVPKFNPNAVEGFIREYKATIAFAKLTESTKAGSEPENKGEESKVKGPYVAKVGDWVQWEHNGILGFPEAKRLKGISPDGDWAYVDGQNGAVPISELLPESAPSSPPIIPSTSTPRPGSPKTHMQEFVVPLSGGGRAVFQWPSVLSDEDKADLQDSLKIVERKILRAEKREQTLETFFPEGAPQS
jgi:hypothetical protein